MLSRFLGTARLQSHRRLSSVVNTFTTRSHTCGELRKEHVGQEVELCGWLLRKRLSTFLILHDKYGYVQAKVPSTASEDLTKVVSTAGLEDIFRVKGVVKHRGADVNPKMETGEIEVEISSLTRLNKSASQPFPLFIDKLKPASAKEESEVQLRKRLTYRYIDMRKTDLQRTLHLRANVIKSMRRCLEDQLGFLEVETPTLASHTPGGAAEFVVPTQIQGSSYALPQSPQLYKQLLMIGQIDRYYQIARCYRDEVVRGDRQPEFTQVDVELSFTTQEQVMGLIEKILVDSWPAELAAQKPATPFKRLTYAEALSKYGSDKPDLRIPWTFEDVSSLFDDGNTAHAFVVRGSEGTLPSTAGLRRKFSKLFPNSLYKNIQFHTSESAKKPISAHFQLQSGDVVALVSGPETQSEKLLTTLGCARNLLADSLGLRSQNGGFNFAWVTDFPLFVESETDPNALESAHHPFTAPHPDDWEKLRDLKDLKHIRAQHYDLVVNGIELGGGSIRIHDAGLQRLVFEDVLNCPTATLESFLEALSLGAPPHGGFALGLDRYIALLASNGDAHCSVRDVIAFPKTKEGKCLMLKTPFEPDDVMLRRYGFHFDESVEKKAEESES
uniref:AA_TRNA_LIGASE_II domain-containing protein n=1 Tax=Panagrellus redivivus TaxID=6233 RepID=A0A7E4VTV4_PANRE